jgi:hypothetical protein
MKQQRMGFMEGKFKSQDLGYFVEEISKQQILQAVSEI